MAQRNPTSTSSPANLMRDTLGDNRSERDHWLHDFRNALGNTTIAASAVRFEVHDGRHEQVESLLRQIEEGCERCLRLLGTMPR